MNSIYKITIITLLSAFSMMGAIAQQRFTLSSMYNQSLYNINPAVAGLQNCFEANIQHKNQWSGLDGKPTNYLFQGHMGLGNAGGIGLNINNWEAGLLRTNTIGLTYAHHVALGETMKLSLGLNGNFISHRIESTSAVVFGGADELLTGGNLSSSGFTLDAGVLLSSDKLRIGLALPQIATGGLSYQLVNSDGITAQRHFLAHASYDIALSEKLTYTPMVLYRNIPQSSSLLDFNNKLTFNKFLGLGIGYRTNKSIFGTIDLNPNEKFRFAYVFDMFNSGNLAAPGGLSHELLLGVKFCKQKTIYLLKIEQLDNSYVSHEFKNMSKLGDFIETTRLEEPDMAQRMKEVVDANPGATEFTVTLPNPRIIFVQGDRYEFQTLEEMNQILEAAKTNDPLLHEQLMRLVDEEGDSEGGPIILEIENKEIKFRTLKELDQFVLQIEPEQPELAGYLKELRDADPDAFKYKVVFGSLARMKQLLLDLKEDDINLTEKEHELTDEVKMLNPEEVRVYFDFNSTTLKQEGKAKLIEIADQMKKDPKQKLVIVGHSCNVGTPESVMYYAYQRAQTVKRFLVKQGVDSKNLSTESKADDLPLAPNSSEENRSKNRRVDFRKK